MTRTWLLRLLFLLLLTGCSETDSDPVRPPRPPGNPGPAPPRVIVLNTLSETLSSLDLSTGEMSVRASDTGAWPNRVTPHPDADGLLVTASGDNEVQILNARDLAPRDGVDVGPGASPWIAVPFSSWEAVVTNWLSGDVRVLPLAGGAAGPPLSTNPGPEGAAVVGGRAYVACTNWRSDGQFGPGSVDVVDLDVWGITASVPVGRNPQDVLIDRSGLVHVLCTGTYGTGPNPEAGTVHVLDPGTLQVTSVIPLGGSPGRFSAGEGDVVWVAGFEGGLRRYDAMTRQLLPDPVDPALLAPGLSAVAWDPVDGTAYVTSFNLDALMAVDGTSLTVTGVWPVGDGPVDVLVLRDGG